VKQLFDWFLNGWRLRRMQRELYALSDHQLRDIGLRREEIPYLDSRS
jgi:uncharacterized protein YjiS (DUF1127 family)